MELLWDVRVSLDVFLGGLGVGAFIFGAILFYMGSQKYASTIKKAMVIAPVLVIAGLLLLLTELGRPLNIIMTAIHINPTSVMSIGIFLQGIFTALAVWIAFLALTKGVEAVSSTLMYVGATLAGLIGFYHGMLLAGIGIEPWNGAIPVMFMVSSMLGGAMVALLLAFGSDEFDAILENFKVAVIGNALITLNLAIIVAWIYSLALNDLASKTMYSTLFGSFGMELFIAIAGLVIPLVLFTMALMKKATLKSVVIPASVLFLVGSFVLKNLIVYLGQAV
ncbi:polysulfide reductase NrfD [Sulfurospirillum sp. T05]|uniref:Polysulfide reductase NrfD n=1 Tax=Sulfurospirillum tamanense TaxID=2813362 RepID=A0ABS2WTH3_9BACT|nr:NrfD/PsrC family molybdoenzyme membrane anchor subunit [Sulfurospirillum tamanensis]MBN2964945.1 polysulfide reductase NrfD [Sulfurospirillum tamanensis]